MASWSVAQFQFGSILAGVHRLRPPLAGRRCHQAREETLMAGRFFFFFFQDQRGCPPPVLSPPSEQHSRPTFFISASTV
jgi:hypothetical protein